MPRARCLALALWTAFLLAVSCQQCPAQSTGSQPELYGYEVVAEYPHDPKAFTQGLQFDTICPTGTNAACREVLWESTGLYGQSSMRLVRLDSGIVEKTVPLTSEFFGEGAARLGNKIYQITWLTNTGFIYQVPSLKQFLGHTISDYGRQNCCANQIGKFQTPLRDGWGITADDKLLVLSDGSDRLTWVDPQQNFKAVRSVQVMDGAKPINYLNELEYIGGEIWANIWQTECVARICPDTGRVKAWLLLHDLRAKLQQRNLAATPMDVLNGIAWDHQRQRLFVTGKQWPRVFEVVPQPADASDPVIQQKRQSCYVWTR
eukprot:gene4553-4805_t